jgi:protein-S-isoprenylcysteine O-methyltransferase Ste14
MTTKAMSSLENYGFPALFAYLIGQDIAGLYARRAGLATGLAGLTDGAIDLADAIFLLFVVVRLAVYAFNSTVIVALLKRARPAHPYRRLSDVTVPLLSTFSALTMNLFAYNPSPLNVRLLGPNLQPYATLTGLSLALAGVALATRGVRDLGTSFSIFIEDPKLVDGGLYRFMRHPIYLGYAIRFIGNWIMTSMVLHLALTLIAIVLLSYRAWLEERRLEEAGDGEYVRYRAATAAVLPGIG